MEVKEDGWEFIEDLQDFWKTLAPLFIILNIAVSIILLVIGVVLHKKVDKTRKQEFADKFVSEFLFCFF